MKHLFEAHSHDYQFHLACPIERCSCGFSHGSSFSSLLSHINRKHHLWKENLESSGTVTVDIIARTRPEIQTPEFKASPEVAENNSDNSCISLLRLLSDSPQNEDADFPVHDPQITAGNLLLMLKERHNMTQMTISFAIDSVKKLIISTCNNLIATASAAGVNIDSENIDPFNGLEAEYFQTKYYKEHLGLVVSS